MRVIPPPTAVFKWSTPIGSVSLRWPVGGKQLVGVALPNDWPEADEPLTLTAKPPPWVRAIAAAIDASLAGKPVTFDLDVVDFAGFTPFRREVSETVFCIPRGQTLTYAQVAELTGRPLAARAIGQVMARNPFPLLIPCHRVLAANGLGGFGGGLPLKEKLLALEQGK